MAEESYDLMTSLGLDNPVSPEQAAINIQFVVEAANQVDALLSEVDPEDYKKLAELNNLRTRKVWDHDKNVETVMTVPEE